MTAAPILFIGNKNYSSWSMRPWLVLRWAGIAFEERVIPLGGPGYGKSKIADVLAVSPSGKVPALQIGDLTIHDSLAISEWAAEQAPGLWPSAAPVRALARAATCEMHSGFAALRRDLSMNIRRTMAQAPAWPDDTQGDLDRLFELWDGALGAHGGPFLFGARSIADAFFAPVCTRLHTYAVAVSPVVARYMEAVFADPDFRAWKDAAIAEPWTIPVTDTMYT